MSFRSVVITLLLGVALQLIQGSDDVCEVDPEAESVVKPLRDFTVEQLSDFKGADCKEIYVAHNDIVLDVTSHRKDLKDHEDRDLVVGMNITGLMFDNSNVREVMKGVLFDVYDNLNEDIKVVGLLSTPMVAREFHLEELRQFTGAKRADADDALQGSLASVVGKRRLDEPILLAFMGRVYDVSYGAAHLYGPGTHYSMFAGRDISKAMVFYTESVDDSDPVTVDKVHAFVDELKRRDSEGGRGSPNMDSLESWLKVYHVNRKYPVVGQLVQ